MNDHQSFNVLEAFLGQMEELFGSLARLLDRESKRFEEGGVSWSVMEKEHAQLTARLDSQLTEFVGFLHTILGLAQKDAAFLKRNRDSIAGLFSEGETRARFLESAEMSIDDERRFVGSLEFLADLRKRSQQLAKDLKKVSDAFDSDKPKERDKNLALIESCRMRAEKLYEQVRQVESHIPGLRDLDAQQARKLGMLSRSLGPV